jgi:SAM-dependent methyltransferase
VSAPAPAPPTGNAFDKYGSTHPVERLMMAGFLRRLDAVLPRRPPGRVLEVGMGEGIIAGRVRARYPVASIVGVDLADDDLADQWRARGLSGVFADISRLPFPDDAADLVLAIEVLEHVEDPDAALAELARVGAGDLVLSVPLEPLWRAGNMLRGRYLADRGNTPGHVQHWSRRGFLRLVSRHLEVLAVFRPLPWTLVLARA